MNINTLLGNLATAISTNAALTTWCNTTYGHAHKVFVNLDHRNPPGDSDCPFVTLYPISKSAGLGVSTKRHAFEVDCCIYDDTTRTTGQVLEYNSIRRVEEFRKLIESAIMGIDTGNALIETVEIEYSVVEAFPFAWAGMVIEINEHFILGSDPLE
ncbi:hypothetical protein [Desulfatitalea tepidiphila]|uniref:hypothetical protein n=1 Tax=Desulfatitalea tepidiphila TaxID=1185843 RepID=UPI0006B66095|nr:hypothetical protein [Desulfatitalea tepidiphila]